MPAVGRLHMITDDRNGRDLLTVVAAGLAGGVDTVQVRVATTTTDRDAYELTERIVALCRQWQTPCLVNDRLHLALATGADGGHVGARDLPVAVARRLLGPHAILGATARSATEANQAMREGASYVGVGPVYQTSTKSGLPPALGPERLRAVVTATTLPVVAIGGITPARATAVRATGAHGIAVVGAISRASDPYRAARILSGQEQES